MSLYVCVHSFACGPWGIPCQILNSIGVYMSISARGQREQPGRIRGARQRVYARPFWPAQATMRSGMLTNVIEILARSVGRRMAEWHQAGYEIQDFACAPCASSPEPSPPPDQRTGIRATPVDSRWSGLRGGRQATVGNGGRGSRQPCLLPARRGAFTRAFMTRGSDSPSGRGAPQDDCTCRAGVYAGL